MRSIRSKDMTPEIRMRRLIHKMGYRFRLHKKDLHGKPDLVFSSRRAVIFVHGCFWHQHPEKSCKDSRLPSSNLEYWKPKLERNKARDAEIIGTLESAGWRVLVIWECETKDTEGISHKIQDFLDPKNPI